MSEMKITIIKDGPYLVEGGVPLKEKIITPKGKTYVWEDGRSYETEDSYYLCRCGKSKNAPFCDGAHVKNHFHGELTASRADYDKRAEYQEGPGVNLMDDNRCAFARFCHAEHGMVWNLVDDSTTDEITQEAIVTAQSCPAGRLVPVDKDGNKLELELEPEITIVQDPQKGVSAGIYVTGGIKVVDDDGKEYEPRSRVMLCRCGKSSDKPFCDASHVPARFNDGQDKK